ncbi:hypothetical protein CR105_06145 [Massilia eurypsychrophila]|uniref:DUF3047 domain-containing protein n=1 Tax=Massilia eurypsychrophila TaxID=1485217 RepID=A0A2G8THY4_9BURK|nr:DUF3047 domain-containing protein [Massilia eurypsychrophila]PIL45657.1 hypothetical protein CR105_06145 [Massilia eurypsychrophila]
MKTWRATAVVALAPCMAFAAPVVPAFSGMPQGTSIEGWKVLKPSPKAATTQYTLVRDADHTVLRADADKSMSGLIHTIRVDTRRYPLLRWRWKVAAPVAGADMTQKSGDDYAARIYVMFDYPASRLPLSTRIKMKLAESLHGQPIPAAALNYVWDNRHPVGTIQPNTYTDRARMVVVRSGAGQANQWVTEMRDLRADFRAAFGEEAPHVVALAIATDTDNTASRALAWYGDIEFLADGERPPK